MFSGLSAGLHSPTHDAAAMHRVHSNEFELRGILPGRSRHGVWVEDGHVDENKGQNDHGGGGNPSDDV